MTVAFRNIDPEDLRQRLESYCRIYYRELREMMSRYSAISESFPYWLKGPKIVLATLCADEVLVTHYGAEEDRFAFGVSDRTVTEVSDAQSSGANPFPQGMQITLNLRSTDYGEYDFAHTIESTKEGARRDRSYGRLRGIASRCGSCAWYFLTNISHASYASSTCAGWSAVLGRETSTRRASSSPSRRVSRRRVAARGSLTSGAGGISPGSTKGRARTSLRPTPSCSSTARTSSIQG